MCTHIWQIHCRAPSCSLLQKIGEVQNFLVGRPIKVAGDHFFWSATKVSGQQVVGNTNKWSVMLLEVFMMKQKLSGGLYSVLKTNANKGKLGHRNGFPNEATEHAYTSHPEALLLLLYLAYLLS